MPGARGDSQGHEELLKVKNCSESLFQCGHHNCIHSLQLTKLDTFKRGEFFVCTLIPQVKSGFLSKTSVRSHLNLFFPFAASTQMIHKLTARALIRDYEDGILHENETNHEVRSFHCS